MTDRGKSQEALTASTFALALSLMGCATGVAGLTPNDVPVVYLSARGGELRFVKTPEGNYQGTAPHAPAFEVVNCRAADDALVCLRGGGLAIHIPVNIEWTSSVAPTWRNGEYRFEVWHTSPTGFLVSPDRFVIRVSRFDDSCFEQFLMYSPKKGLLAFEVAIRHARPEVTERDSTRCDDQNEERETFFLAPNSLGIQ